MFWNYILNDKGVFGKKWSFKFHTVLVKKMSVNWYHRHEFRIICLETWLHIDGLVQERRNSIANALELRPSCTNLSSVVFESSHTSPGALYSRLIISLISWACQCLVDVLWNAGWLSPTRHKFGGNLELPESRHHTLDKEWPIICCWHFNILRHE